MRDNPNKLKIISFKFEQELINLIERLAKEIGVTRSTLTRAWLWHLIEICMSTTKPYVNEARGLKIIDVKEVRISESCKEKIATIVSRLEEVREDYRGYRLRDNIKDNAIISKLEKKLKKLRKQLTIARFKLKMICSEINGASKYCENLKATTKL